MHRILRISGSVINEKLSNGCGNYNALWDKVFNGTIQSTSKGLIPWNSFYICYITVEMERPRHLSCFHCSRNRAYNYLHKVGKYLNTSHCMYSNRAQFTMQILQEREKQADQKENCEVISQLRCGKALYI